MQLFCHHFVTKLEIVKYSPPLSVSAKAKSRTVEGQLHGRHESFYICQSLYHATCGQDKDILEQKNRRFDGGRMG
jgi:hypothetical protein